METSYEVWHGNKNLASIPMENVQSNVTTSYNDDFTDLEIDLHLLANITRLYQNYRENDYVRNVIVVTAYAVIFFISLFGNLMVCHIIVTNNKLHTFTNFFIANLSVADLLMTLINVPFGLARLLLNEWPFGSILCKCLPFIQATSVYVSTITMCIISIDRYCVVVHPLGKRITNLIPLSVILLIIWIVSGSLSLPFAYFNEVIEIDLLVLKVVRCRSIYPSVEYNKGLTVMALLTQYLIPLAIALIAYLNIAFHIKKRSKLGAMTREQIYRIMRTNRQTIIMLVLVLIVFAICWLPLHLFHLYRDFIKPSQHNTRLFLFVHWLAMSSICYNPFIYSARNRHFRNEMKNFFRHFALRRKPTSGAMNSLPGGMDTSNNHTQLTLINSVRMVPKSSSAATRKHHSFHGSFCSTPHVQCTTEAAPPPCSTFEDGNKVHMHLFG